jgi:hypothetical protein
MLLECLQLRIVFSPLLVGHLEPAPVGEVVRDGEARSTMTSNTRRMKWAIQVSVYELKWVCVRENDAGKWSRCCLPTAQGEQWCWVVSWVDMLHGTLSCTRAQRLRQTPMLELESERGNSSSIGSLWCMECRYGVAQQLANAAPNDCVA